MKDALVRIHPIGIIGALAFGATLIVAPNEASAQYYDYYNNRPATLGYCQRNPGSCDPPEYWDYENNRPATLGYCQRNPGACDPRLSRYERYRR